MGTSSISMTGIANNAHVDPAQLLLARNSAASAQSFLTQLRLDVNSEVTIDNLPDSFTKTDVEQMLQVFGQVMSCTIDKSAKGLSAKVTLPSRDAAKVAVEVLNGISVLDHPIAVRLSCAEETPLSPAQKKPEVAESNVLVLSNIIRHPEDTDESLKTDFLSECSKLGIVKTVFLRVLDPENKSNEVYVEVIVEFENVSDACVALKSLSGRWFDKRQIRAEFKTV